MIPVSDKPYKAPGPRKSTGKPSAGGTKTQTKTATGATRPAKDKATPKQKSTQNSEGSVTKAPAQKVIRRVHAVVEVPIKVEDDEDELVPDENSKPSKTTKKPTKPAEPPRAKSKSWQVYQDGDGDTTPPARAPVPKRRKSGTDQDYYEPSEDIYNWQSLEDANVRHRPPARRKSIKVFRESDFDYHEEEEEEETDADELNLGVSIAGWPLFLVIQLNTTRSFLQRSLGHDGHQEKPVRQQRANETSSNAPARKNARKRKAVDAMDTDEPAMGGRGKAAKTR